MLRLLPDHYTLGLFPGSSWRRCRRREHTLECHWDGKETDGLLRVASELLCLEGGKNFWTPRVDLILSDQAARMVLLPWQDKLRTPQQTARYAEVCLIDSGVALDSAWVVQATYRRFGAPGLAFALRREVVDGLVALGIERRVRLRSLLPLSTAAYWSYRGVGANRNVCLLLQEAQRFTAFRYHGRCLVSIDVEPVIGAQVDTAVSRLLRRQCVQWTPGSIDYWSAGDYELGDGLFSRLLPETPVRKLASGAFLG